MSEKIKASSSYDKKNFFKMIFLRNEIVTTIGDREFKSFSMFHEGILIGKVSKDKSKELATDTEKWFEFLNSTIGAGCFVFALACQGTPNPPLNALISLIWFLLIYLHYKNSYFPKYLKFDSTVDLSSGIKLMGEKKARKLVISMLRGKYLSILSISTRAPFFAGGYLYLILIASLFSPHLQYFEIFGHSMANIFLPEKCVCLAKNPNPENLVDVVDDRK